MPSYLMRVQLPDRPGSLGSLAVALGSVNADILSLDVVDRGADYAVDDLVVELPVGAMPDTLISAAERLAGVRVDSVRPYTDVLDAHRELELVDHIAAAGGRDAKLQLLVDEAPRVLRAGWCAVVSHTGQGPRRLAGSPGAPETTVPVLPWLPLARATALDGAAEWVPPVWQELDTALAAAPLGRPEVAVVLGRAGGPAFRASEVARLGYLAGIVATLLG
ncbi:amino acid-binding protein [Mycolicibacillus koreensis]|nr:amino acid-binding protein [Mycolicibacillus koreensis]